MKHVASRQSSIRFRNDETKDFMGFKVREQYNLGVYIGNEVPQIIKSDNVPDIDTHVRKTSE